MWKEVIELHQDPRIFGIIFIAPVVQLAVLGCGYDRRAQCAYRRRGRRRSPDSQI
jgi:hypothetical protein